MTTQSKMPVELERPEVYESAGLPDPRDAFLRAKHNAKYYYMGRWRRVWWQHRIEAVAAERCGISLLITGAASAYDSYLKAYAQLAAKLAPGDTINVNVVNSAVRRQVTQGERQYRFNQFKKTINL